MEKTMMGSMEPGVMVPPWGIRYSTRQESRKATATDSAPADSIRGVNFLPDRQRISPSTPMMAAMVPQKMGLYRMEGAAPSSPAGCPIRMTATTNPTKMRPTRQRVTGFPSFFLAKRIITTPRAKSSPKRIHTTEGSSTTP